MAQGKKTGGRQKGSLNKATADVKAAAQKYTDEAVRELARIMRESDSDRAKVSEIKEILDRGHGKPKQAVDVAANLGIDPGDGEVTITFVRPGGSQSS